MESRKILVIQHDADDGLKQFAKPLLLAGLHLETWNVERSIAPQNLDPYHGLIILGSLASLRSPTAIPWIGKERELLQEALASQLPTLGICFGAQHLALAAGGSVRLADLPELGWQEISLEAPALKDSLLKNFPTVSPVFQWHYDCIALPSHAVLLATGNGMVQAFSIEDHAWGLQFHVELDPGGLASWLGSSGDELQAQGVSSDALMTETRLHCESYAALAEDLIANFALLINARTS